MISSEDTEVLYRGMGREALDVAYNNAAAVVDSAAFIARWDRESVAIREQAASGSELRVELNIRYANTERGTLDLFLQSNNLSPTLVFIHGGYWQLNSKDRFSFVAKGPLSVGMNVAILGYTLAPQAHMDEIVQEVRQGVRWVTEHIEARGGDPKRIGVAGWSAGGHLAALAMSSPNVQHGLTISGIFDLEPIRLNYLNNKLQMTEDEARRNSPIMNLPTHAGYLTVSVGAEELPELKRQSSSYYEAWRAAGLQGRHLVVPGRHHFAVLEELARSNGALVDVLRAWEWR